MRVTIDDIQLHLSQDMTILAAARQAGVAIPTLCFMDGCEAMTSCYLCVVKVEGSENLLPACATPAADGMVIRTDTPEVLAARKTCLELLLSDHLGDCVAPCEGICPAHLDIPRMLRLVAAGDFAQAATAARHALVLPASLGWICPAPCQKGCRRASKDAPLAIRRLHRLVGEWAMSGPAIKSNGKTVAIIGAGPAGLSVAYHLLERGYGCTIFDEHDCAGGMLRYGLDDGRLPHDVLAAETGVVAKMGGQFRMGVRVGRTLTLTQLQADFGAVVLATGPLSPMEADTFGVDFAQLGLRVDGGHATNLRGVFAAGDAIRKHRMAVRAVGDGAAAAACVEQYLTGLPVRDAARPFSCHIGPVKAEEMDAFMTSAAANPTGQIVEPEQEHVTDQQASEEAARCLHCDCRKADACRLRTHCQAIGPDAHKYRGPRRLFAVVLAAGNVIYEPGKCIACGLCVRIVERSGQVPGLTFIGRGLDVRPAAPLGYSLAEALGNVAAECVAACPTAALAY